MVRRPSSSAETSIDEDTADQLLADDFSVPSSPVASRSGILAFARPTSSAFDTQRRTPSLASSQGQGFQSPHIPRTRNSQFSMTNTDPESYPPSLTTAAATAAPFASHNSSTYSLPDSDANPFSDPPELVAPVPETTLPMRVDPILGMSEKKPAPLPPNTDKQSPRRPFFSRKGIICIAITTLLLIVIAVLVPVGLLVIKPKSGNNSNGSSSSSTGGLTKPDGRSPASLGIPDSAIGTVLDSTKWLDWTDFNVTYTAATVGGLSLMVDFILDSLTHPGSQ